MKFKEMQSVSALAYLVLLAIDCLWQLQQLHLSHHVSLQIDYGMAKRRASNSEDINPEKLVELPVA